MNFITIFENGLFAFSSAGELKPVTDLATGAQILKSLKKNNYLYECQWQNETYIAEAFDYPLVAQKISAPENLSDNHWLAEFAYGVTQEFSLNQIFCDEWDRFISFTSNDLPFVMSRQAQEQFFSLLDEFDDENIFWQQKKIPVRPLYETSKKVSEADFWSDVYKNNAPTAENPTQKPGWEMETHNPILTDILKQIKMPRSRIAVLGCGSGNDAFYLAKQGHIVTAFDFSEEAIKLAQKKYQHSNLSWEKADVLNLDEKFYQSFDVVLDHTFYCAIDPSRRSDLVKTWKKLLVDKGFLLGIFFGFFNQAGPPFGGTEWEMQQRIKKSFKPIYWNRCRNSVPHRLGTEFVVYALKQNFGS